MRHRYSGTYAAIVLIVVTLIFGYEAYNYCMDATSRIIIRFKTMDDMLNGNP